MILQGDLLRLSSLEEGVEHRITTRAKTLAIQAVGRTHTTDVEIGLEVIGETTPPLDGEWLNLRALEPGRRYLLAVRGGMTQLHLADGGWNQIDPFAGDDDTPGDGRRA